MMMMMIMFDKEIIEILAELVHERFANVIMLQKRMCSCW